ncbi:MAG: hypothetical protein K1X88_01480 [Nannocystaceae bacterium]|nr:hypothetical protein [Nannocystaceae bacterium]
MESELAALLQVDALLVALDREVESNVPVVRLVLADGRALDVFRATRVRERPVAWRIRGFVGDIRPTEFVAVLLGTQDGRALVTAAPGDTAEVLASAQLVVQASAATRRLADLAEVVAARVRARFG